MTEIPPFPLTPNLDIIGLLPQQEGAETVHNEALGHLDGLVHMAFEEMHLNTPPAEPNDGERWIVGPAPTGDWASQAGKIAHYVDGWEFRDAVSGMFAYDRDSRLTWLFNGTAWVPGGARDTTTFELVGPVGATNIELVPAGLTGWASLPVDFPIAWPQDVRIYQAVYHVLHNDASAPATWDIHFEHIGGATETVTVSLNPTQLAFANGIVQLDNPLDIPADDRMKITCTGAATDFASFCVRPELLYRA